MWTQVSSGDFLTGTVTSKTRGDITYSLHRAGPKGWVVKRYRGKMFASRPELYNRVKRVYDSLAG